MALDVLDVRFTPRESGHRPAVSARPGAARRCATIGGKPRRSAKADIGLAARTEGT